MKTIPRFTDVQAILDRLVGDRQDALKEVHGETFGWSTSEELVNAVVEPGGSRSYRLIDPELVKQGRGADTNLIVALTRGAGGFSRMPLDGPYASEAELQTIIDWINAGCPESP